MIGSGAGAGPIVYELTQAGYKVVVLEKGEHYQRKDFSKDEIANSKRDIYTPNMKEEYHEIEEKIDGKWVGTPTSESGWSFSNGSLVGGASNFMSGYFHRLKPNDFRLKSAYGEIKGANVVDWPISYDEMEPFYTKAEKVVGISGVVSKEKDLDPRSTKTFPYPALVTNAISKLFDNTCKKLGINPISTPRAILSSPKDDRNACYYSNYCGSYACSSGAKGSSREAFMNPSLKTKNLTLLSNMFVKELIVDENNKIKSVKTVDKNGNEKLIHAKLFVLSAGAIESVRLLLLSKSKQFPNGLCNNYNQVGKNVISTAGGMGSGVFDENNMPLKELLTPGLFVNRSIKDWYYTKDFKSGVIDFLFEHANPTVRANKLKWGEDGLLWGKEFSDKVFNVFTKTRKLNFETFIDWLPTDDGFVKLSKNYKDKYNLPVALLRLNPHPHDAKIGEFLDKKARLVLKKMGAKDIESSVSYAPSPNLMAGGCRFGDDEKKSVLNKYCQSHVVKNLFVADGSFMPTGGSVPYTWTIYANSFRVADFISKNFKEIII